MSRLLGAARRRRARVKEMEAQVNEFRDRVHVGGDELDMALMALDAVVVLADHTLQQLPMRGDELACLLNLIGNEMKAARAVQRGDAA